MNDRCGIVKKYTETETKLFMTLAEAEILAIELAVRIRQKFASDMLDKQWIVVGIANGGLMVAKIVAETLGSSYETISIRRSGTKLKRKIGRYKWVMRFAETLLQIRLLNPLWRRFTNRMKRLEIDTGGKFSTEPTQQQMSFIGKHVILVDDCIESGETIRLAKKTLLEAGANDVITGVLTLKNIDKDRCNRKQFDSIVYLNTRIQHYPWSQNNKEYENFLYWLKDRGIKPWL